MRMYFKVAYTHVADNALAQVTTAYRAGHYYNVPEEDVQHMIDCKVAVPEGEEGLPEPLDAA
jgi:hypothetical protein